MSATAVVALQRSEEARRLAAHLAADLVVDKDAFQKAFPKYRRIVALMSAGIVVRKIAPLLEDKWKDPAVVVVSPDLRYAVPILGGHHGANALAKELEALGIVPVITTATESLGLRSVEVIADQERKEVLNRDSTREVNAAILRSDIPLYRLDGPGLAIAGPGVAILLKRGEYVVGIGCRKGVSKDEVAAAIQNALADWGIALDEVMAFATTAKKMNEEGLVHAVQEMGANLIFVDDRTINAQAVRPSAARSIGLVGVSEPAALAISRSKELVKERKVYGNVTVAVAR